MSTGRFQTVWPSRSRPVILPDLETDLSRNLILCHHPLQHYPWQASHSEWNNLVSGCNLAKIIFFIVTAWTVFHFLSQTAEAKTAMAHGQYKQNFFWVTIWKLSLTLIWSADAFLLFAGARSRMRASHISGLPFSLFFVQLMLLYCLRACEVECGPATLQSFLFSLWCSWRLGLRPNQWLLFFLFLASPSLFRTSFYYSWLAQKWQKKGNLL